jgi:hypothetical protein
MVENFICYMETCHNCVNAEQYQSYRYMLKDVVSLSACVRVCGVHVLYTVLPKLTLVDNN